MKQIRKGTAALLILALLLSMLSTLSLAAGEAAAPRPEEVQTQENVENAEKEDEKENKDAGLPDTLPGEAPEELTSEFPEEAPEETEPPEKIVFEVDGELVEAVLETPEIETFTLRPVQTYYNYNLTLRNLWPDELRNVKIAAINGNLGTDLWGNKIPEITEPVWWSCAEDGSWADNDDFHLYDSSKGIDLNPKSVYDTSKNLHLIVGEDQFDESCMRYIIRLSYDIGYYLDWTVHTMEDTPLEIYSSNFYRDEDTEKLEFRIRPKRSAWDKEKAKLGITLKQARLDKGESLEIYRGYHETLEAAQAAERVMENGALAEIDVSDNKNLPEFTIVVRDKDKNVIQVQPFYVDVYEYSKYVSVSVYSGIDEPLSYSRKTRIYTRGKLGGPVVDDDYLCFLKVNYTDYQDKEARLSALYEGSFSTKEEAEKSGKENILSKLYGEDTQEKFDFKEKREFTAVDQDGDVHRFSVVVKVSTAADYRIHMYSEPDSFYPENTRHEESDYATCTTKRSRPGAVKDIDYLGFLSVSCYDGQGREQPLLALYEGSFSTKEEAEKSGQENILAKLHGGAKPEALDFKNRRKFTAIGPDGSVYRFSIAIEVSVVEELQDPLSADTYFRAEGAAVEAKNGETYTETYRTRVMPYQHDSYYYNGYQTVFLLNRDGSPLAEETTIYPAFYTGSKVNVYAGHTATGEQIAGVPQESQVTPQIFKNGEPIHYSAGAENRVSLKNYWATFLTQTDEPKLFVNGVSNADSSHKDKDGNPKREVILDGRREYHHDIFIANLGKTPLTDLTVELKDAENIELSEYWTVEGTKTLPAFTDLDLTMSGESGMLDNVSKIRLLPKRDENGEIVDGVIKGTLIIKGGGETYTVNLRGQSGDFAITTDTLLEGVKYVPYSSVIQTNNMYNDTNEITFKLDEDSPLPQGLTLNPNGEIVGVPKVWSDTPWEITVVATSTDKEVENPIVRKTFKLTIKENTNENVWNATDTKSQGGDYVIGSDTEYTIIRAVVNQDGTVSKFNTTLTDAELSQGNSWDADSQVFMSKGEHVYFRNVYLDGEKLTSGYTHEPGSTVVTLTNQTLEQNGGGTHTLAVEFRESTGDDPNAGRLRRASQNYTLASLSGPDDGDDNDSGQTSGSGNGGSTSSGGTRPTGRPASPSGGGSAPGTAPSQGGSSRVPMADVDPKAWYYEDVAWAYEQGLMTGVSGSSFAPGAPFSRAAILTVLARLAKVDLNDYKDNPYEGNIPSGMWYTPAAVWAVQAGMISGNEPLKGDDPLPRGEMAVILVKYLRSLGVDTSVPTNRVEFADASSMTQEVNDAFQVLYSYGIFKGMGGNRMGTGDSLTRAQFSALLHRLSARIG